MPNKKTATLWQDEEFKQYVEEAKVALGISVEDINEMMRNSKTTYAYLSFKREDFELNIVYNDRFHFDREIKIEFKSAERSRTFKANLLPSEKTIQP